MSLLLTGAEPSVVLPDEVTARITPRLFRLARRHGQSADDYVRRLSDLLDDDTRSSEAEAFRTRPGDPRASPTLERLHGMDEAVAWGLAFQRDLDAFRAGRIRWAEVDRGCLLSGPPGFGKTLFARALATTCDVDLVAGSYADWIASGTGHQGDLLRSMKQTFDEGRKASLCVQFIDEIDSFPNRASVTPRFRLGHPGRECPACTDRRVEGRGRRRAVAACNHLEKLDPALVRSGRLDRHIRLSLPTTPALAAIMRERLGEDLSDMDLTGMATFAAGSTGADCERFVRGARRRARVVDRPMLPSDLRDELGGDVVQSDKDARTAAIHEAGHVVVCVDMGLHTVASASMRADGDRLGGTAAIGAREFLVDAEGVCRRLVMLLAGRAAEEVLVGVQTSGAGGGQDSDLARATVLTLAAMVSLGLDRDHGRL